MNRQNELTQLIVIEFEKSKAKSKCKETIASLIDSWKLGLTNVQAASDAGITESTLQNWLSRYPELKELRTLCYDNVNRMARTNIHRAIKKGSVETSKWFLERTDPEFNKRDQTAPVQVNIISVADREKELKKFMERFTDAGVIDTVVTEEREVCPVGEGEDTTALQEDQRITG